MESSAFAAHVYRLAIPCLRRTTAIWPSIPLLLLYFFSTTSSPDGLVRGERGACARGVTCGWAHARLRAPPHAALRARAPLPTASGVLPFLLPFSPQPAGIALPTKMDFARTLEL